jgi:hypothetical protein
MTQPGLTNQYAGMVEEHPCQDCEHSARCAEGRACAVLRIFIVSGRISAVAPRQPSTAIFAQIFGEPTHQPARRPSTMLAIGLLRANPCRMR